MYVVEICDKLNAHLELLNDEPNRIAVFVGQLMLASILLTIPYLVFKRIELNTSHRGLG